LESWACRLENQGGKQLGNKCHWNWSVPQRYLVYPHSIFSKSFPEAVTDEYKWITDSPNADLPHNYGFSLTREHYV
jgi:hypothetical protein